MATKLTKSLIRESLDKFDDREIMVNLTEDQNIELKLKGMKSGMLKIGILELYKQLKGVDVLVGSNDPEPGPISIDTTSSKKSGKSGKMVNLKEFLQDLRSHNAISMLDVQTMTKFDGIIKEVIDKHK